MYTFAIIDPRRPFEGGTNVLGIEVTIPEAAAACGLGNIDEQHAARALSACCGAELVFEPARCAVCDKPAHARAAIEVALDWPLPADAYQWERDRNEDSLPPIATLATVRPDLDSVGAMAVLVLRKMHFLPQVNDLRSMIDAVEVGRAEPTPYRAILDRVARVATADNFSPGGEWAARELPTASHPWGDQNTTSPVDATADLAAIASICSPQRGDAALPIEERVVAVATWLLCGEFPDVAHREVIEMLREACAAPAADPWIALRDARARVEAGRLEIVRALDAGEIELNVSWPACPACSSHNVAPSLDAGRRYDGCTECGHDMGPHGIAVVRSAHPGAMALGYCRAPVVVAHHPSFRWPNGETTPKFTIAWWRAGMVDRDRLIDALNVAEHHWRLGDGEIWTLQDAPKWGGAATIVGSPQGQESHVAIDHAARIVREAMPQ